MAAFRSQLRRAVLVWFYCNPKDSVYVRELAAILRVDSTDLSRELASLAHYGFLRAHFQRNQLHYTIYRRHKDTSAVLSTLAQLMEIAPGWQPRAPKSPTETQ